MMERLGRLLSKKSVAWAVIIVTAFVAGVAAFAAQRVERNDDVLEFLPEDNPEVAAFQEISATFGGLRVAIVGIATSDPFDGAFLQRLRALTRTLADDPSLSTALSLATVDAFDLDPKKGGIVADYLVNVFPETEEEKAALRARVMQKDHIVGHFIAPDASAVIVYAFLADDADLRQTASLVREHVESAFPEEAKYWGGMPFISTYIYDVALDDMKRLIPWAVVVIVVIVVASFRDPFGALLALMSTGAGIVIAQGLMGATGVHANIVLSSMPVILFAVGSAYGIHFLVRYYSLRAEHDCPEAVTRALAQIGPTVTAAGLTTVAGLLSFLTMDITPLRQFGLFTGVGILATLVLALTFVPAVVRVAELKPRSFAESAYAAALVKLVGFVRRQRRPIWVVLALLAVAGGALAGRVEARMGSAAFFEADSPPAQAERFLSEQFGGSQFVQIRIEGDMTDPAVLRELQRVADRIRIEPHVSSVTHVAQVLALVNEAMSGERRVPPTQAQVQLLYRFLAGREALRQLVTEDHRQALLQVKVDTDAHEAIEALLGRIDVMVGEHSGSFRIAGDLEDGDEGAEQEAEGPPSDPESRAALRSLVVDRIAAESHELDIAFEPARATLAAALDRVEPQEPPEQAVVDRVATYLRSEESLLERELHQKAEAIAQVAASMAPEPPEDVLHSAIASILKAPLPPECVDDREEEPAPEPGPPQEGEAEQGDPCLQAAAENERRNELAEDVALGLATPLREIWRQERARELARQLLREAAIAMPTEGATRGRYERAVGDALLDLERPTVLLPAAGGDAALAFSVNGVPVLYRALSRSVTSNQLTSLAVALGLVLVIMIVLFRSVTGGMLAATPTALTLLVIYGAMGALGIQLDIGTSMLASMIIGAGVDYAVHLLAGWRARDDEPIEAAGRRAAQDAGPAIATNALMVGAGFFVLTLGQAKPLQNVGGLTSAALIAAGLATFVAVPALARRRRYGPAAAPPAA
jgi:hypothetical protein